MLIHYPSITSRVPIVHRSFYTGEWDSKYRKYIDYSLVPIHVDVDHGMVINQTHSIDTLPLLIHSLTHSPIHPPIHPLIHTLTHPSTHSFTSLGISPCRTST